MEPCKWDEEMGWMREFMGKVKEFIDSNKGTKVLQYSIVGVIIVQVGAFLVMWGSLTTTVKAHTKDIDKILTKLDNVKIVGYAIAGEK